MLRQTAYLSLVALLLAALMAGCGGSGSGGSQETSAVAPQELDGSDISEAKAFAQLAPGSDKLIALMVVSTTPISGAAKVSTNANIILTFSHVMNASTITKQAFTVMSGTKPVAGTVSYASRTAIFKPSSALAPSTVYTATMASGVTDWEGTPLPSAYTWNFTTGTSTDTTAPTITGTGPIANATGVATNRWLSATFSEAVDPALLTKATFTLKRGTTPVSGTVACMAGRIATFVPTTGLAPNTKFTATISTNVKDMAGNALTGKRWWQFTTGATTNSDLPAVTSTSPADGAKDVSVKPKINAILSDSMFPSTIWDRKLTLHEGTTPVAGASRCENRVATFVPQNSLKPHTTYTATIVASARDIANNELGLDYVWHFTTGLAPVPLNSAGSFAILAGSTVTNSALQSTVNGDLGVSPGTAVTGFPPGIVNGTMHRGDPAAAQAKLDLTAAYNDAAGRSTAPITVAGNLGGQTLYPGLYKSTSSLAISSGNLTLDARGDVNAVFVFQMASTFTMTSGRQIILSGGAKAANIYWQVGTSATLGSTSVFKGNILSDISITVNTGARVDGRLLTRTGAVTLDGNTVSKP